MRHQQQWMRCSANQIPVWLFLDARWKALDWEKNIGALIGRRALNRIITVRNTFSWYTIKASVYTAKTQVASGIFHVIKNKLWYIALPAFWLVNRQWYMSSYTIDHKYGSRYASTKTAWELKYCNSLGVFNKTIISLALVGYEIVIASRLVGYPPSHIQRALVE